MERDLRVFKNTAELADQVSDRIMKLIADSSGSHFNLAISGGSTPCLLFSALASKYADSILWQKTHFWWVDERMVANKDSESNFGTAQRMLLSKIDIPEKNIHPIHGEANPPEESENYAQKIRGELPSCGGWPLFDLILLGMGEDGHTASIFPNHIELMQSDRICDVACHPLTDQPRITLTGRVLNNAARVWFLITGTDKAERLAEIISRADKAALLPAALINPVHGELSWYLDELAARLFI
jgi:6-phosphogluconolactonase